MPRSKNRCLTPLIVGLLLVSAGCQFFPSLGSHRTNRYGVPVQSEPDISGLEQSESTVE